MDEKESNFMFEQQTESAPFDTTVRTVLFDFDGTLVFHTPDSFDVISSFCAEIGQPLSTEAERQGRRTRHEYFVDPVIRDQLNELSQDQFWQHFNRYLLQALHIDGNLDRLSQDVTARFANLDLTYECPQDGCHTLTELRARGYSLGLITNRENVQNFYRLLGQLGDASLFRFRPGFGRSWHQQAQTRHFRRCAGPARNQPRPDAVCWRQLLGRCCRRSKRQSHTGPI